MHLKIFSGKVWASSLKYFLVDSTVGNFFFYMNKGKGGLGRVNDESRDFVEKIDKNKFSQTQSNLRLSIR